MTKEEIEEVNWLIECRRSDEKEDLLLRKALGEEIWKAMEELLLYFENDGHLH